jgi:hypothetical protein
LTNVPPHVIAMKRQRATAISEHSIVVLVEATTSTTTRTSWWWQTMPVRELAVVVAALRLLVEEVE